MTCSSGHSVQINFMKYEVKQYSSSTEAEKKTEVKKHRSLDNTLYSLQQTRYVCTDKILLTTVTCVLFQLLPAVDILILLGKNGARIQTNFLPAEICD